MPIGVADCRQIATACMSQHLQRQDLLDIPDEDSSSIYDLQAGHSRTTAAMRYGRTTFESQFMDRNVPKAFQTASRE